LPKQFSILLGHNMLLKVKSASWGKTRWELLIYT